jgi:glycosyltransferase involved in cell wall biosynthesis
VLPDQIIDYLQQAHLAILPSKSENFGHSIYEALSVGKPVITSFGTPWLNLKQSHAGLNVDPETIDLQNAISFFADMDHEEYGKWCTGASEYAGKAIDRGKLEQEYVRMFNV